MDLEATGRSFQDSEGLLGAGLANALSRIARGRLGMRRVAAFSQRVSVLGERNAVAATHIDHSDVSELGSVQLEPLHHSLHHCSETRQGTRRRSEHAHRSAHRCKQ